MPHAYPNFLNKGNDPLRMQMPNCFSYLSVFVYACENLVMANDVATPSNLLVALIEQEEFEETSLDVNVFQWSRKKELSRRLVCTQVNRLAWDRQLFPSPHALAIYLKCVPTRGAVLERLKSVNVKMTLFVFIVELGFLVMAIIISYKAQSTLFPWSIESNTSLTPFIEF
jgi:hypothetical protein